MDFVQQDSNVETSIGEITLPTYRLLGENRNPIFQSRYGVAKIYPYTLQDEIDTQAVDVQYRTLVLENRYLRLTVLPDLGGRVYSLYDKLSQQEVFYKNPTIKFSPLAIRGAFFSGGLEFSFPVAHAPTTAESVNWDICKNPDGSASITIGGLEHMSGMRWAIRLSLYPERCALSQDVWLHNPTLIPGRYHYWTNASTDSNEQTEFVYPLQRVRSYEFAGTASWPISRLDLISDQPGLPGMEGVPMWPAGRLHDPYYFRWEKNMLAQVSIFGRDVAWDYFGAWQHTSDSGYAHHARYQDVSGMKLWSWGKSEVGVVNQTALMDDGSLYAETQCGAMETQLDFAFLPPGETKQWREWWLPLRGMGGLTCASQDLGARLNLSTGADENLIELTLGLCPVHAMKSLTVSLTTPDRTLFRQDALDIDPESPWMKTISLEAQSLSNQPIKLSVLDSNNHLILSYTNDRKPGEIIPDERKEGREPVTAEDFFVLGLRYEELDNREKALASYRRAIAINPNHGDSNFHLGLMLLRSADFTGAKKHLSLASQEGKDAASYYLGLIGIYQDELLQAEIHLGNLSEDHPLAISALRCQAAILLRRRQWRSAVKLLAQTPLSDEFAESDKLLQAIALQRAGDNGSAFEILEELISRDPLNLIALQEIRSFENRLRVEAEEKLNRMLADDKQYILDLVCFYLDAGLAHDALNIIEDAYINWPYPMLGYLAAYITQKIGLAENAAVWREKAHISSPDLVFPNRLWEIIALQNILSSSASDSKAQFYLGNFYYARERYSEAIQLWKEALTGLAHWDVLHRNLGIAYWQFVGDLPRAEAAFEQALAINPNNQDLYLHLDAIYKQQGKAEKREELLGKIIQLDLVREDVRRQYVTILVELNHTDEALKIMRSEQFLPLEMDQSFHQLYVRALLQSAESYRQAGKYEEALVAYQQALEFPVNHGVGRPVTESNASIYYHLGCTYEFLGKYKQAIESWKRAAQEHHPLGDQMFRYVQYALDKLGRYSELGFEE